MATMRPVYITNFSRRWRSLAILLAFVNLASVARASEWQRPPISYNKSKPTDAAAQLAARLDSGKTVLRRDESFGYLKELLKELDIPASSQTLVFSRTSFQRDKISPQTPRALYFNDDLYVGFVHGGEVLEIAAADPKLGVNFYTLDQAGERARITRQTENCLQCHSGAMTRDAPGLMIRSVYPDPDGQAILTAGTYVSSHESPLTERWGGWYVTGTTGRQQHMGNSFLQKGADPNTFDYASGANITSLTDRFDASGYLSGHSDVVALLVLEHQTEMHNRITRANYETRQAMAEQQAMVASLKSHGVESIDDIPARVRGACDPLLKYMPFSGETVLTDSVRGTSHFAQEYAARGPRDSRGRSLRELDLNRRLLKYPCSPLIYCEAFNGLPDPARAYVYRRLWEILTGRDDDPAFGHISADDLNAIYDILRETKPDLPAYWKPRE